MDFEIKTVRLCQYQNDIKEYLSDLAHNIYWACCRIAVRRSSPYGKIILRRVHDTCIMHFDSAAGCWSSVLGIADPLNWKPRQQTQIQVSTSSLDLSSAGQQSISSIFGLLPVSYWSKSSVPESVFCLNSWFDVFLCYLLPYLNCVGTNFKERNVKVGHANVNCLLRSINNCIAHKICIHLQLNNVYIWLPIFDSSSEDIR